MFCIAVDAAVICRALGSSALRLLTLINLLIYLMCRAFCVVVCSGVMKRGLQPDPSLNLLICLVCRAFCVVVSGGVVKRALQPDPSLARLLNGSILSATLFSLSAIPAHVPRCGAFETNTLNFPDGPEAPSAVTPSLDLPLLDRQLLTYIVSIARLICSRSKLGWAALSLKVILYVLVTLSRIVLVIPEGVISSPMCVGSRTHLSS